MTDQSSDTRVWRNHESVNISTTIMVLKVRRLLPVFYMQGRYLTKSSLCHDASQQLTTGILEDLEVGWQPGQQKK
jgi:hypothetical protein